MRRVPAGGSDRRCGSAVDAFVDVHASNTPDQTLLRLAADLYETRLKPTLGHGAPEWGHEARRQHYTTCCYDKRRTLMAMLRDLRGIAERKIRG